MIMWLLLTVALACDPPALELRLQVVAATGGSVAAAEVWSWSRGWPSGTRLGATDGAGVFVTCVSPGTSPLGVYAAGLRPRKVSPRAGRLVVKLEAVPIATPRATAQAEPCV